jgi:pyridoxal phosphate enzyme (YggS family)
MLQEGSDKGSALRWHLIGSLQRNKVKYIIDKAFMIHSLDSLPLAREINRHAERIQRVMPVLVQVNAANEETKSGLPCEETIPFIESVFNLKYIKVAGLMMIAPKTEDPELVRPYFHIMKQLYDDLVSNDYPHTDIRYLSMGMSNDFETAIEEGSNMVRIGTAIFGKREKGDEPNGRQIHE